MPDKHKHPPLGLRLPEADRTWLLEYAAQAGRPVNAVLAEALAEYRQQHEEQEKS